MKPSPPKRTSQHRSQLAAAAIILILAALLAPRCSQIKATASISGLTLGVSLQELENRFGDPDFQTGSPTARVEYWSFKKNLDNDLQIELHDQRAYQIRGGTPEIDGVAVADWSPQEIMARLGPPANMASGKTLCPNHKGKCPSECSYASHSDTLLGRNSEQATLSYPAHHLLVNWSAKNGVEFVLFSRPDQLPN